MRNKVRKRCLYKTSYDTVWSMWFCLAVSFSFSNLLKSLKVGWSDHVIRPRFHNGIDAFSTPSSTPETPSSWPPRPALTGLGPTCVADHVVPVSALLDVCPLIDTLNPFISPFPSDPWCFSWWHGRLLGDLCNGSESFINCGKGFYILGQFLHLRQNFLHMGRSFYILRFSVTGL